MFSFFHKTKQKNETALIFVVESGKVIGSVVKFEESKPPRFLYSHRESITYQQDVLPERLKDLMLSSLKSSAEKLANEAFKSFSREKGKKIKTYIFLGSPWYVSVYLKSEKNSPKIFLVTDEVIKETANKNFENPHEDIQIIEQKILGVKANGYFLQNPKNQKTTSLTVESLTSSASKELLKEIENMISLSIIGADFEYHTTPQAIFPVARELVGKKDFVIFIPEHEISDLIVVRGGQIEKTVSIPFGKHSPTRGLVATMKGENISAYSLLLRYIGRELDADTMNKVKELVNLSKSKFEEILREALWQLASTIFLPQDIVIADGHPVSKLLGEWIQNEEFSNKTMTIKSFSVYFMQNKDIIGKIAYVPNSDIYLNPLLISIALYLKSLE